MLRTFITILLLLQYFAFYAQIGIGTFQPNESSVLDISATNTGLLIPRISLDDVNNSSINGRNTNAQSLLIYNTNASTIGGSGIGFYYWEGTMWTPLKNGLEDTEPAWSFTGNTTGSTDFLGTLNNQPLNFRVNNISVGSLKPDNSINLGRGSESSLRAVALGFNSQATREDAISLGHLSLASGLRSTALGFESKAHGEDAVAIGRGSISQGPRAMAFGFTAFASAEDAIAYGTHSQAASPLAIASGAQSKATNDRSSAYGSHSTASGSRSTALGTGSNAQNTDAIAIGSDSHAEGIAATAMGNLSVSTSLKSIAMGYSAGAISNYATALGDDSYASRDRAIAFGSQSSANGDGSLSIGFQSYTISPHAIAIGSTANAHGEKSLSLGYAARTTQLGGLAIGNNAESLGQDAIAIGAASLSRSNEGIAVGSSALSEAINSMAIGNRSQALGQNAIAIGNGTTAPNANTLVLGNNLNVGIGTNAPTAKLQVNGGLRFVDGAQGAGKVLTSDANGNASWQTLIGRRWSVYRTMANSASQNTRLATNGLISLEGLFQINIRKENATFYEPNIRNISGTTQSVSFSSGFEGATGERNNKVQISVANGAYLGLDENNLSYWSTTATETLTADVILSNGSWYELQWFAFEKNSVKQIYMTAVKKF